MWQAWGEDKTEVSRPKDRTLHAEDFFENSDVMLFISTILANSSNTGETGGEKDNASFKPLSASFWSGGGQGDDHNHDSMMIIFMMIMIC